MTYGEGLSTIFGSAIFGILVILFWRKFVDKLGSPGGFIAALIIPGTMWVLNHGIENSLIKQSGSVWIDMAIAVGIAMFISSKIQGGKIKEAQGTLIAVIVATVLSGYVLTVIN